MIRFECDYNQGAHEKVLQRLVETNGEQTPGYGEDLYCQSAKAHIRRLCGSENADIYFIPGGTQANTTVIVSVLRPHQGVISADTGHIASHESGAVEATGHKVLAIASDDGKITAQQVRELHRRHWGDANYEHLVQPGMVYISHPTENGTVYTKAELQALSGTCKELGLPLFMDGARLGYGLASSDLTLADIARLCDVFYIGGTKVGAFFGEAVVIPNDRIKTDFRYFVKQRGGLMAKGRLMGLQFEALFESGLYLEISRHAVEMAARIRRALEAKGFSLRYDSPTNQQFPIFPNDIYQKLSEKYAFSLWEPLPDQRSVIRICTSWSTQEEHVEALVADIMAL